MKNQKDRKGKKKGKKSLIPSFLTKLYQILENTEYHNIVKWADNGKAFIVKNLPEFIEVVLPSYFKHNNFASFVRQLNMYDFHKTRNNNNENTFYHKLFIRGQKNLLKLIKRKINNHFNSTSDDTELSEMLREERDSKLASKRSLDDLCTNMLKNFDELSKKFNETEKRIDTIVRKNDEYIGKNKSLINELTENKNYAKNLESLIFFIFEFFLPRKTLTKEKLKEFFKNDEYISSILDSYGEKLYNLIEKTNQKKLKESKFKRKKSTEKSKFKDFKSVGGTDMFDETNSLSPCMLSSPTVSDDDYSYLIDNDIFTPKKENFENFMNTDRDKNNIFHF